MDDLYAVYSLVKSYATRYRELESIAKDMEALRNAFVKVVGGVRALRSRVKNLRSIRELDDVQTAVNTIVNLFNRVVEIRNLLLRARDAVSDLGIAEASRIDEVVAKLDRETLRMLIVTLWMLPQLKKIERDDSGRLASSLGTALFAALLNVHEPSVRNALKECLEPQ